MAAMNYAIRYRTRSPEAADNKATMKLLRGVETVLIVEDEESILNLSKEMLEMLG
jgi:hypothetical protein